ncbi:l-ascorbate oxidase-like protein [Hordeum vulgare]|nr:l-ascorbate oxidase-like protein [Hordeum vulgare]
MASEQGRPPSAASVARGSHSDLATTSGVVALEGSMSAHGGGGAWSRGLCGAHGPGRRSAIPAPPSSPVLGGHSDGTVLEFVMEMHVTPWGHLHLPRPFARAMEAAKPPVLWLRAYGCSHSAMQAHVEYPKCRSMLLGRGWKSFARAHGLGDGHILRFKIEEDNMLSVNFFGRSRVRLDCWEGISSGVECPSSSDSDEEDSGHSGALGNAATLLIAELGSFTGASDPPQVGDYTLPATSPPARYLSIVSRQYKAPTFCQNYEPQNPLSLYLSPVRLTLRFSTLRLSPLCLSLRLSTLHLSLRLSPLHRCLLLDGRIPHR